MLVDLSYKKNFYQILKIIIYFIKLITDFIDVT